MLEEPENRWPVDGHDHHIIDRKSIYENAKIKSFLDGTNITLLIANKGMGKTLLLRVKRKMVTEARTGLTLIPSSDAEFDEPKLHGSYPSSGYNDLQLWKDMWTLSIVLSCLSHLSVLAEEPDKYRQKLRRQIDSLQLEDRFKDQIAEDATSFAEHPPSHYLAHLVDDYTESQLQKLRKSMHIIDDIISKYISSGITIFIDAFDQSLQETFPENLGAWRTGQLGLVKAAHTLFTKNHHIKVFATIRQEAWAGFNDADRAVIMGKSLILEPTENDLKKIFLAAIKRYSNATSVESFLGIDVIHNVYCNENEDCFKYLLRHSSGTPRSMMLFGRALDEAELSDLTTQERVTRIREIIDETSAENIFTDYLESQKQMFMKTLHTENRLRQLFALIPANVLTAESLRSINIKFCIEAGLEESSSYPFCELFNSGLLGRIQFDSASGNYYQFFRKPYQFDWVQEDILRRDTIYVLHPGLISHLTKSRELALNRFNIVGTDYPWSSKHGHTGIPTIFISHSSADKQRLYSFLDLFQIELDLILPSNLWIDQNRISPGEDINSALEHGVSSSDIVVLFASESSLSSGWVEREWRTKHKAEVEQRRIQVVVAIIDKTDPSELPEFLQSKRASLCSLDQDISNSTKELARAIAKHAAILLEEKFVMNGKL